MRPGTSPPAADPVEDSLDDVRSWVTSALWVGGDDDGPAVVPGSRWAAITSNAEWHAFLGTGFLAEVLLRDGAVVVAAQALARQGHGRELVALDQSWGRTRDALPPDARTLGDASARVGRRQLDRLRPLRDQRWLERYRAAITAGDAQGWHPVVHGILLGLFALPLRPGLLHYGRQVAAGFLTGTPLAPRLEPSARDALLDAAGPCLVDAVSRLLPPGPFDVV